MYSEMGRLGGTEAARPDAAQEAYITNLLRKIGVPAHIYGYRYLREAIMMVVENGDNIYFVTKNLYPAVAAKCMTTAARVERAIRHAVRVAWSRGSAATLKSIFGHSADTAKNPTNCEFIAQIAETVRMR